MQRDGNSPFESAIGGLHQNCLKGPFRDHVIATENNRVSLEHRLWVKFPCLLEEFGQALLLLKLQSNSVIFEPKLLGKVASHPRLGRFQDPAGRSTPALLVLSLKSIFHSSPLSLLFSSSCWITGALNQDCPAIDNNGLAGTESFLHQKQVGLRNVMSFADSPNRQTLAHALIQVLPFGCTYALPEVGPNDSRRYRVNTNRRQLDRQGTC